jgi:AICAR transformylase/IMP cyclohydrolase PurH
VGVLCFIKEENLMTENKNQADVLKNLKRKQDLSKRKENRAKQTALKEKEKTAKYEEKIKKYENFSNDFLYYLFHAENEDEKQKIIHY